MKKKILILCLVGIMSMSLAGCNKNNEGFGGLDAIHSETSEQVQTEDNFEIGMQLMDKGDYANAAIALDAWIKENPEKQQGYVALAKAFLLTEKPDGALEILNAGMKLAQETDIIEQMIEDIKSESGGVEKNKLTKTQFEYSPDGNLVSVAQMSYDDRGNKIGIDFYDRNGKLIESEKRKYDDNDNMIEKASYDAEGKLIVVLTRTFDENNKLISEVKTDDFNAQYEYDSNGNCSVKYYSRWGLDSRYKYKYDNENRKIIEEFYDSLNSKKPLVVTKYEYDDNGNLILESTDLSYIKREYNSNGDLVSQSTHRTDGSVEPGTIAIFNEYDDMGRNIKETHFDHKGNVISYFIYEFFE